MIDLSTATATQALAALQARDLSSLELLEAQLARVEKFNPDVNAVVAMDIERARAGAIRADEALARGEGLGPLHGLPITIKDLYATEGLVTTSGYVPFKNLVPKADSAGVAALKKAGAIVYGKTNAPEFGADYQTYNDIYGLSRNPWNLDHTCGGSSGGAAVSVATGMSLLELGGDIGGSIRVPCHYNGVFGHKPTWGAVNRFGEIPLRGTWIHAPTDLVVMGPIGRSVSDVALGLDVLTAATVGGVPGALLPPASTRSHSARGLRVAILVEDDAAPTDRETKEIIRNLGRKLADAGSRVEEVEAPGMPLKDQSGLYQRLLGAAMQTAAGAPLTHADWKKDDEARHRLIGDYARFFETWDVILAPIAPTAAFTHRHEQAFADRTLTVDNEEIPYAKHLVWAGFATLPGLPATAVPLARSSGGLPIGAQVVGAPWSDKTTLAVAGLIETLNGGFVAPPGY
jgi:amidase